MNLILYANRNRIKLIGIMAKKNSNLYKNSDIKILLPEVKESGHGIVPTSSTAAQLALGDALAISLMVKKNFTKLDFKKYHPSGNLAQKLKTVEDLMLTGNKIPFISENAKMDKVIKLINEKLGVVIVRNKKLSTSGIFTDGDIKRTIQMNKQLQDKPIKSYMTKNPISIDKDMLAENALGIMNEKKVTSICVHKNSNKKKTIGILHIHHLINAEIS